MEVGGDARSVKAGHGEAVVGTTRKGGVGAAEAGWRVKAVDAGPGVELILPSGREVEE